MIDKHTMEITGGKTYAELEGDDPNRDTAMTSWFLQASLFTSVVAFGVAAMAIAVGIAFVLFGLALRGQPQPGASQHRNGLGDRASAVCRGQTDGGVVEVQAELQPRPTPKDLRVTSNTTKEQLLAALTCPISTPARRQ